MENYDIYLLLLVAVGSGWVLGVWTSQSRRRKRHGKDIFEDYFVGLNYLLNDEPDEAIDTFISALELHSETGETHLALGALLRRRGKVDKAIRVHQALLARPSIESELANATRLQLAMDFISAGLLDRAERLLKDTLQTDSAVQWDALRHLSAIYQTEKEWEKAIDCCARLLANSAFKSDEDIRAAAANYCCELAEQLLLQDQVVSAKAQARRAFTFDRKSIRASLQLGGIESRLGNFKSAIKELIRIRKNNPEFTSSVLGQLQSCYEQIHALQEFELLMVDFFSQKPDSHVLFIWSRLVLAREGPMAALQLLQANVQKAPSLTTAIESLGLQLKAADNDVLASLKLLQSIIDGLQQRRSAYQCHHCGYESRNLYWLCPSCQKWDKIRPISSVGL